MFIIADVRKKYKRFFAGSALCGCFFSIVILLHPQKNRHLPEKQMPICVTLFYA